MNRVWSEIKAGWKEAGWISSFSVYLILFISLVVLIGNIMKAETSTSPSQLQIFLAALCALVSYFLARRRVKGTQYKEVASSPGTTLLALVDFLYSPARVELTFNPLVADWRHEYFEALVKGRKWKAQWVSVRYGWAFITSMCITPVFSLLKHLRAVSKKG